MFGLALVSLFIRRALWTLKFNIQVRRKLEARLT